MKGHIFSLLEEFIIEISDEKSLFEILDNCSFDTSSSFVRALKYPDEDLFEMVSHTIAKLGITLEEAQYEFGKWLYTRLITILPREFTDYDHPAFVLSRLDNLHKVELTKLYPDATPPSFIYTEVNKREGILDYHSDRKMFSLVEGVLQGMADYYQVEIESKTILNWQDDHSKARFLLTYSKAVN